MIRRIVEINVYGTRLEHIAFQEQLSELNSLSIDNLLKFIILTKYYFAPDFKPEATRQKQTRKTKKIGCSENNTHIMERG